MRDLELLATFLEVYRAGSMTSAAAALGLSQPAVSERITRLEAQSGNTLFTRSARGVAPTAEADRLVARVAEPVDRLRQALTPGVAAPGHVRIGGASDVVAARLIPALAPLTGAGVSMEFTLGLAPNLLDSLVEGVLDLVVSSIRPSNSAIRYRGLIDEEFVLIAASSIARTVDRMRYQDDPAGALAALPMVAYDAQLSIVRRYWRSQFGHRPSNRVSVVVPDLRGVLAAVIAGAGMSALPRYIADPALASGSVELLHQASEAPINTLHVAVRAGTTPSPATAAVISRLIEKAREWDSL